MITLTEVLRCPDLTDLAKVIYTHLATEGTKTRLEIETAIHTTTRSTQRAIKELVGMGLIQKHGNTYTASVSIKWHDRDTDDADTTNITSKHDTDDAGLDSRDIDFDQLTQELKEDQPAAQAHSLNSQLSEIEEKPRRKPTPQEKVKLVVKEAKRIRDQIKSGIDPKSLLKHSLSQISIKDEKPNNFRGPPYYISSSKKKEYVSPKEERIYKKRIKDHSISYAKIIPTMPVESLLDLGISVVQIEQRSELEFQTRSREIEGSSQESLKATSSPNLRSPRQSSQRHLETRIQKRDSCESIHLTGRCLPQTDDSKGSFQDSCQPNILQSEFSPSNVPHLQRERGPNAQTRQRHSPRAIAPNREGSDRMGRVTPTVGDRRHGSPPIRRRRSLKQARVVIAARIAAREAEEQVTLARYREARRQVVKKPSLSEMQAKARQKAIDKATGVAEPVSQKEDSARSMAYAYEEVLGLYIHKPTLNFIKRWDPNHRNSNYFHLAAQLADEAGADYEEFVWAQFYFIHTWYGRSAKPHEIRSKTAVERWQKYKKLKANGTISGEGKVYSSALPSKKMSWEKIDKINQGRLVKLMRVWNLSAEDVIIRFANSEVFDEKWLKRHPIYKQLKAEGRL